MKTRRVTLCHMPKTSVIRFRCDPDIAARFERVAALRRREESDLARIWFEDMILAEEQRLGLVLSTQTALRDDSPPYKTKPNSSPGLAAAEKIIAAAGAHAANSAPTTPAPRVKYPTARRSKKK